MNKCRNGQNAKREDEHSKKRRPVKTLLNDASDRACSPCTVVLCDHGGQPRDEPDKSTEYGEEDACANGNAREILLADMPRHDRIEEPRCHQRNLCDKDREEHGEELPRTCRIAMNLLQAPTSPNDQPK